MYKVTYLELKSIATGANIELKSIATGATRFMKKHYSVV